MQEEAPYLPDENKEVEEPPDDFGEAPLHLPIDGILDLHTFSPRAVDNLIGDYIEACLESSILDIRIIHGKGTGAMRDRVYKLLSRHPAVESFKQAPLEAGGWGAVLVRLRKEVITDGMCI